MMTEKERLEAIHKKTATITDDLCHLKDLCLADSTQIDWCVKNIYENLSSEMQEGFKRYFKIDYYEEHTKQLEQQLYDEFH